jgi:hypothetical protein
MCRSGGDRSPPSNGTLELLSEAERANGRLLVAHDDRSVYLVYLDSTWENTSPKAQTTTP